MNREIKFRGKTLYDHYDHYASPEPDTKEGTWVYGDLITEYPYHKGLTIVENGVYHEVDPETVGQKSGLKERPGTKDIWQGDVVKITLMDTIRDKPIISDTCSVELRNGMFGVEWGNDGHFIPLAQFAPGTRVEVIGVFCDNPELLEVEV